MRRLGMLVFIPAFAAAVIAAAAAQAPPSRGIDAIAEGDLRQWLTYIASDELQGRATYSEGLGHAAGYISAKLRDWGVKPAGDGGTYLQAVPVESVRVDSRASVTVQAGGRTRTFHDGQGISFQRQMGGRQTITSEDVVFAGYGLQVPAAGLDDLGALALDGRIVVFLGAQGPEALPPGSGRLLSARARNAIEKGAIATIGPVGGFGFGRGGRGNAPGGGRESETSRWGRTQPDSADFTTVHDTAALQPPQLTAEDEFFEFLFSGSEIDYAELKARSQKREALPRFALKGVRLTVDADADYQVVRTRFTNNIVGIVEGSDPVLKNTYVAFGAHYDHTGYLESGPPSGGAPDPGGCTGQVRPTPAPRDNINNGADDDGSGTVALMALAKAFATGPRPKRSLLFVWHSGEENGLLGSRYHAEHPAVPLDRIVAQLNIDMIGRNRCDDPAEANTVYVVGADRISTELHNANEEANASLPKPLTLDYQMNDPADPQSIYTRSDHYSYAVKGIPIIFYFTGLHQDYHFVTDEVSKIEFPKLTRITQLVYETARRVADMERAPVRDVLGPRAGKGFRGKLPGTR